LSKKQPNPKLLEGNEYDELGFKTISSLKEELFTTVIKHSQFSEYNSTELLNTNLILVQNLLSEFNFSNELESESDKVYNL
jgi:hypothetical protein